MADGRKPAVVGRNSIQTETAAADDTKGRRFSSVKLLLAVVDSVVSRSDPADGLMHFTLWG